MKSSYMFAVILLLCFGVGLTQAEEYAGISGKLLGVTTLFSAALAPKVCVFDYRHSKNLSELEVILAMTPVVVVTLASIAWGGRGISKTMSRCKDLNYDATLKLLQRLVMLVVILIMVTTGVLVAQVMDKPGAEEKSWQYHMFWGEAAGELVHLIVLASLMFLCQPSPDTFRA